MVLPDRVHAYAKQILPVKTYESSWTQSAEEAFNAELHVNLRPVWAQKAHITDHNSTTPGHPRSIVSEPRERGSVRS